MAPMSILQGPTEPPRHMPTKLKVVLAVYVVSMLLDVAVLMQDGGETRTWVRLAIGGLVIAFLLRGSDSVRSLVRGFAALGTIFGVVIVLQAVSLGFGPGLVVLAMGLFAVGANAFTFWALGQDDVQTWMATRTFQRVP